uniref:Mpv17-like protein n=1 Tax=Oryzias latipes TaxID=8090 RepID=A0A3P9IMP6_ORYLA
MASSLGVNSTSAGSPGSPTCLCTAACSPGGTSSTSGSLGGQDVDWKQTRNVAVVAFTFHGNFNFFWMRFLERRFPGTSAGMLLRKVLLDQTAAAPLATSVFYTGVSFLEGKDDIMEDWRENVFLDLPLLNFALVPLYMRTTFTGCCAFVWATFLCFSRQTGDGTAAAALAWIFQPEGDKAQLAKGKAEAAATSEPKP